LWLDVVVVFAATRGAGEFLRRDAVLERDPQQEVAAQARRVSAPRAAAEIVALGARALLLPLRRLGLLAF